MSVKVQTSVTNTLQTVWRCWTNPADIQNWNFASEDWCCPEAINDLTAGGRFNYRMEAKDGSFGFDFEGTYTNIQELEVIEYKLEDERKVSISFEVESDQVIVTETFDPETENPIELQQQGWQAILDNFKLYTETKN